MFVKVTQDVAPSPSSSNRLMLFCDTPHTSHWSVAPGKTKNKSLFCIHTPKNVRSVYHRGPFHYFPSVKKTFWQGTD
jgi:hypothetical protein